MGIQLKNKKHSHTPSEEIDLAKLFEKDESFARHRVAEKKKIKRRREVRRRLDAYFEARALKQALMDY